MFYTVHDRIQDISSRDPACSIYFKMWCAFYLCHKPPFLDNLRVFKVRRHYFGHLFFHTSRRLGHETREINLVKGERKCLWTRDRIQMGLLKSTRAAALRLTSAEREFPFPVLSARLCSSQANVRHRFRVMKCGSLRWQIESPGKRPRLEGKRLISREGYKTA